MVVSQSAVLSKNHVDEDLLQACNNLRIDASVTVLPVVTSQETITTLVAGSLETLYADNYSGLLRFLVSKLQNKDDAEDIAQAAFIRIKPLLEKGLLDDPVAYLFQTARNLIIDHHRHKKIQRKYINGQLDRQYIYGGELEQDCSTPERVITAKEDMDCIVKVLENMPESYRQTFFLHRMKGLTYSDIAKEKNVSISSIEKYILRALKQCREAVEVI